MCQQLANWFRSERFSEGQVVCVQIYKHLNSWQLGVRKGKRSCQLTSIFKSTFKVLVSQQRLHGIFLSGDLQVWRYTAYASCPLRWRHNERNSDSNHQPHGCLLKRLFRRRSRKTTKLRVTGLCVGNSPGPVNSPHKWPVTWKMFPFDDVIMHND